MASNQGKRGDYVDFVRGITPIMTELFRLCLKMYVKSILNNIA